ncbi:hypothetical protein [Imbroritus primus]|uniref:hypothetical protein n=1 Tax=Imbroritus primus TaxID=3058603 RepID=UPI003D1614CD
MRHAAGRTGIDMHQQGVFATLPAALLVTLPTTVPPNAPASMAQARAAPHRLHGVMPTVGAIGDAGEVSDIFTGMGHPVADTARFAAFRAIVTARCLLS